MRSTAVVVPNIDAQDVLELAAAEDEDPVEAVGAHGADSALGEGVCVWRLDRGPDHFDVLGAEDLVERAAELAVAIMDEEPERVGCKNSIVMRRRVRIRG